MTDVDFVIWLWDKAKVPNDARVKEAAANAFTAQSSDPESCYRFITDGIFTAHQQDVIERMQKAQRDQQRLKAAEVVGWFGLTQNDLDVDLKEFVFRVWERAEPSSEVRTKAAAVLTPASTDDQRTTYLTTEIFTARDLDRQRRQEQAQAEEQARQARLLDEERRAHAWTVVARAALTDDLKVITHREFTYELFRRATGAKMRAAAQTAMDTCKDQTQQACKDFIYTGVDRAHQADLEERDRQDAIETERRIREILDRAERDGYLPTLAAAARTALASDLTARHTFLNTGQYDALKRDQIKPSNRRVVEFQGIGSGRCIQVSGVGQDALQDGRATELWTCGAWTKQVWELLQYDSDEYLVQNLHSKKCMGVVDNHIGQNPCDSGRTSVRWKFIENTTDGSFQLQNVANGKFATAEGGATADATLVVQHTNTNGADQRWRIIDPTHRASVVAVNTGVVKLKGVQSSRCIQVSGTGQDALQDLRGTELWDCTGGDKMRWEIIALGENKYALKNKHSGKCLDVRYGDHPRGTPWIQYGCHYGAVQQFVFTRAGDNTYGLQNVLTGQYADAVGNAVENGSPIQSWNHTGLANQRWKIVYETA